MYICTYRKDLPADVPRRRPICRGQYNQVGSAKSVYFVTSEVSEGLTEAFSETYSLRSKDEKRAVIYYQTTYLP